MNVQRLWVTLVVAVFGFTAGSQARAVDLAQAPLFLIAPVKPALVMAVDDSGSMDAEIMLDANDGAMWWNRDTRSFTGWGTTSDGLTDVLQPGRVNFNATGANNNDWRKYFYLFPNGSAFPDGRTLADGGQHYAVPPLPQYSYVRSPQFNPIYFNPLVDYPPYPSNGTTTFTDATPASVQADAVLGTQTWNVTEPVRNSSGDWTFRFQTGMVIPGGTIAKEADNGSCNLTTIGGDWAEVPFDTIITNGPCNVAIQYYPATFWLTSDITLPGDYGYNATPLTGGRAPNGTPMRGYEIRPENFSSPTAYDKAMRQFANWFQYYRKRSHLTRGAIGRSFEEVDFMRVGTFTINNRTDVSMLDMASPTDRASFYDTQYSLRGSGGTPNRQSVEYMGNQFKRADAGAPIVEACQKNFGMLVTDGFANSHTLSIGNTDGDLPPPLGDTTANTMADLAYTFYRDSLRTDLEQDRVPVPTACNDPTPHPSLDCRNDPHMNMYSVTLGAKGLIFGRDLQSTEDPYTYPPSWPTSFPQRHPSSVDDLWHAVLNTRGEMFSADRPDELVGSLSSVLISIASAIQPVGVSSTSTRLDEGSLYFESELDSTTWSGNIKARNANDDSLVWTASGSMPGWADRNIFTWGNNSAERFDTSLSPQSRQRMFEGESLTRDQQDAVINYLRGNRLLEQPAGPLRERDGVIGDIANSRPASSVPRNEGWARLPSDAGGGVGSTGSYGGYLEGTKASRPPLVLVGANDGMLHAFNAESGRELFAYVPAAVQENLFDYARPSYEHRFYVDGQIAVGDANLGGWKTVAVGTLGAGGRSVFALDITNPDSFGTGDVLWELSADDHPELGHVFGRPIITRLGNGTWVTIFGNGYNSDTEQATLFVVRLSDGDVLQKIPLGRQNIDNGLSEVAAFLDPVSRLFVKRIYGGDLKGNMWRVDFTDSGVGSNAFGSSPLLVVDDNRPITAGPTLAAGPAGGLMVYFGSGKLVEASDRTGNFSQFERFWAVQDQDSRINGTNQFGEAVIGTSDGQRTVTGSDQGGSWYMDLGIGSPTGERVLSRPQVVFGQLIFSTFEPDDDPCTPGGFRRIYVLDALSGNGLLENRCENCGVIEVGVGAPVDPSIVLRPPAAPDPDDGDDGDPWNPGDGGSVPGVDVVGSRDGWCSELLMLVPGEGFVEIGRLCDGRQVWRQAR